MESMSMILSASLPIQNHSKPLKSNSRKPISTRTNCSLVKGFSFQNRLSLLKTSLSLSTIQLFTSLPSPASEALTVPAERVTEKINLESIVVSVDDFFNRNPFFVAGCAFIWLVVIPLTRSYLSKCKLIPAIDAFRKLRDGPDSHLLDIRDKQSVVALRSPNLKILNKNVVQVEYSKEDEDAFVKNVKEKFQDPSNTVLCIMDSFDDNSLTVAELLFKNGFKEAYAMRGGIKGKRGWLAIQEELLPPAVHMKPEKKKKKKNKAKISHLEVNGGAAQQNVDMGTSSVVGFPVEEIQGEDSGHTNEAATSPSPVSIGYRSPYPNYSDFKPPSSPTPSQPQQRSC